MGAGGRGLRTILQVPLYPGNNRKILMSVRMVGEGED